jgi:hypothetical protein
VSTVSRDYAQTTLALIEDSDGPSAAALFDIALTTALVAMVSHDWPEAMPATGRVPSARHLLKLIEDRAGVDAVGVAWLAGYYGDTVPVPVTALCAALDRTQPVRHGRGGDGSLLEAEVDALQGLDRHPALGMLTSTGYDKMSDRALRDDAVERARAADFAAGLDDAEMARRVELASADAPCSPKDLLDWAPPQECPVCGQESLAVERTDDFGHGIGAGTCSVCTYRRSAQMMHEMALAAEWEIRWEGA